VEYLARTEWRMGKNAGLEVNVDGVGGRDEEVPIERSAFGGVVGRRVRRCVPGDIGDGK
jgi:hypothetical protein